MVYLVLNVTEHGKSVWFPGIKHRCNVVVSLGLVQDKSKAHATIFKLDVMVNNSFIGK